jgi:hypothetical protein
MSTISCGRPGCCVCHEVWRSIGHANQRLPRKSATPIPSGRTDAAERMWASAGRKLLPSGPWMTRSWFRPSPAIGRKSAASGCSVSRRSRRDEPKAADGEETRFPQGSRKKNGSSPAFLVNASQSTFVFPYTGTCTSNIHRSVRARSNPVICAPWPIWRDQGGARGGESHEIQHIWAPYYRPSAHRRCCRLRDRMRVHTVPSRRLRTLRT